MPFSIRFPSLYRVSSLYNALIFSILSRDPVGNPSWNFHFRRDPSERELGELVELLTCLEGVR